MKKIAYLVMILCLSFTVLLTGCDKESDPSVIRLNEVTHSIFYAPLYAAINEGFFEEENIKIELTNGGGSDVSMNAILSGSADIGLMGPEAAVYVAAQGRTDLPVIFGQLTKRDGSFLVGRTADENFEWTDLIGAEIIAGRRGGMPAMNLEYALKKNGIFDQVTLNYDIAFANTAAAFQGGTADYVTAFEPTASTLVSGGAHIVASVGEEAGEVPFTAFMANQSYIDENQDKISGFLKAIIRGYNFVTTAPIDDVVDALAPSFDTTEKDVIKKCVQNYILIDAWSLSPVLTESSYNRMMDVMIAAGELDNAVTFSKVVNNTYAQKVLNDLAG